MTRSKLPPKLGRPGAAANMIKFAKSVSLQAKDSFKRLLEVYTNASTSEWQVDEETHATATALPTPTTHSQQISLEQAMHQHCKFSLTSPCQFYTSYTHPTSHRIDTKDEFADHRTSSRRQSQAESRRSNMRRLCKPGQHKPNSTQLQHITTSLAQLNLSCPKQSTTLTKSGKPTLTLRTIAFVFMCFNFLAVAAQGCHTVHTHNSSKMRETEPTTTLNMKVDTYNMRVKTDNCCRGTLEDQQQKHGAITPYHERTASRSQQDKAQDMKDDVHRLQRRNQQSCVRPEPYTEDIAYEERVVRVHNTLHKDKRASQQCSRFNIRRYKESPATGTLNLEADRRQQLRI